MASLPPLSQVVSSPRTAHSPLASALSTLFEPSTVLLDKLVPELTSQSLSDLDNYSSLIDIVISTISSWDPRTKAAFIAGHPRIGEAKNLSHLSQQEQAAMATPPEVLARLAELNALYEMRYPGLVYITFVNGRSRVAIKEEMEAKLGVYQGLNTMGSGNACEDPMPVKFGSFEWLGELDRAVGDIEKIAKSRLGTIGVE